MEDYRLSRQVVESPALEELKRCVDEVLRSKAQWWIRSVGFVVGPDDLKVFCNQNEKWLLNAAQI